MHDDDVDDVEFDCDDGVSIYDGRMFGNSTGPAGSHDPEVTKLRPNRRKRWWVDDDVAERFEGFIEENSKRRT